MFNGASREIDMADLGKLSENKIAEPLNQSVSSAALWFLPFNSGESYGSWTGAGKSRRSPHGEVPPPPRFQLQIHHHRQYHHHHHHHHRQRRHPLPSRRLHAAGGSKNSCQSLTGLTLLVSASALGATVLSWALLWWLLLEKCMMLLLGGGGGSQDSHGFGAHEYGRWAGGWFTVPFSASACCGFDGMLPCRPPRSVLSKHGQLPVAGEDAPGGPIGVIVLLSGGRKVFRCRRILCARVCFGDGETRYAAVACVPQHIARQLNVCSLHV